VVRNPRFHRRGYPQGAVNQAEVVVGEVQTERGPRVLPLLREGVRQSGELADLYPHGEVLALAM
jgi:hypothetical protein